MSAMRKLTALLLAMLLAAGLCACGASSEGDVPDFEKYNITAMSALDFAGSGKTAEYDTICQDDGEKTTAGTVLITGYSDTSAPEGFSEQSGCTWKKLTIELTFGDEAANEAGYRYCYKMSDYYDIKSFQDSLVYDSKKECETFKIKNNGKKYTCYALININSADWTMDEDTGLQYCKETLTWTVLVPDDYDGLCIGLYDAAFESEVSSAAYITDLEEEAGFVFFRLD